MEEIQEHEECKTESNGESASKIGYTWYTVNKYDFENEKYLGDSFDVYSR